MARALAPRSARYSAATTWAHHHGPGPSSATLRRVVRGITTIAALFCVVAPSAHAFATGDFVPLERRTLHADWRTEWSPLQRSQLPRFGEPSTATLRLHDETGSVPRSEFKMSFAFDGHKQLVPWITVIDEHGSVLDALEFTLHTDGGAVTRVTWQTHYTAAGDAMAHGGAASAGTLKVHFEWEAAETGSPALAMALLFVTGAAAAVGSGYYAWEHALPARVSNPGTSGGGGSGVGSTGYGQPGQYPYRYSRPPSGWGGTAHAQ